jgi:hypothetical protein
MFWNGVSTPTMPIPDWSDCMISAPRIAPVDRPHAAGERRAPDHRRGDHAQLVQGADVVGVALEARLRHQRRQPAQEAHQREDLDGEQRVLMPDSAAASGLPARWRRCSGRSGSCGRSPS